MARAARVLALLTALLSVAACSSENPQVHTIEGVPLCGFGHW